MTSGVQNAFLTARCEEKVWTILGKKLGNDASKCAIIVSALYALPSDLASSSTHVANCMQHMGYKPCKADGDLWMKPMICPDDLTLLVFCNETRTNYNTQLILGCKIEEKAVGKWRCQHWLHTKHYLDKDIWMFYSIFLLI